MARGRSVIEVAIIGDVKNLQKSFSQVNAATGGLAGSLVKGFVGLQAIDKSFEFIDSSLAKADEFSDAMDRLDGTIGKLDSQKIEDIAFDFTGIGLSADEVGSLAANFAALATAAGVSAPTIANLTPDLLEIAAAVSATTGKTLDEVVSDIGKAAAGNQKSVSDYGIVVNKALNPEARLIDILEQAKELFPEVSSATDDYAGKQEQLNAKWDNFSIKVGAALEGPLSGVLDFFITMIDRDIPKMMEDLGNLGDAFVGFGRTALGPLGNVRDALEGLGDLIGDVAFNLTHIGQNVPRISERDLRYANSLYEERNSRVRP